MGIFSRFQSRDGVKEDTGFHEDVLLYVWRKYKDKIPDWGLLKTFHYFYLCYVFLHQYPRVRQFGRVLHTKEFGAVDKKEFYSCVFNGVMASLAANMDEIKWTNRLHDFNHSPHFKSDITCLVDTFPIYGQSELAGTHSHLFLVYQPVDDATRKSLYAGKYKATVKRP